MLGRAWREMTNFMVTTRSFIVLGAALVWLLTHLPPASAQGSVPSLAQVIGGVFQGYTLGNILSGVFYQTALQAHPTIPDEIARGKFDTLHTWLKNNIYQYGSKFTAPELIERVTGGPLRIEPYIAYLRKKYGELYGV